MKLKEKLEHMNQSKLIWTLSLTSIIGLILTQLFIFGIVRNMLVISKDTENQAILIDAANQFMDGSAYLTDEVRAYAATMNQVHYQSERQRRDAGADRVSETSDPGRIPGDLSERHSVPYQALLILKTVTKF